MAPDPSPDIAEESDKPTGFFSLPRELRDTIYDMAREEGTRVVDGVMFTYCAAVPKLRLVSRQLKSEYDQRPAVDTSVHVFDLPNKCTFKHFPRLATMSRYLEFSWTREDLCNINRLQSLSERNTPIRFTLSCRLGTLERLVRLLPEVKEVHVKVVTHETHNLKTITDQMIACPVLTSFSIKSAGFLALGDHSSGLEQSALIWVPWSRLKETVDLAIWSRGHGFLVDNTDEEKPEKKRKPRGRDMQDVLMRNAKAEKLQAGCPALLTLTRRAATALQAWRATEGYLQRRRVRIEVLQVNISCLLRIAH
jgi:hypothetical protein